MEVPPNCVMCGKYLICGPWAWDPDGRLTDLGANVVDAFGDVAGITGVVSDDVPTGIRFVNSRGSCHSCYTKQEARPYTFNGAAYDGKPDVDISVVVDKSCKAPKFGLHVKIDNGRHVVVSWQKCVARFPRDQSPSVGRPVRVLLASAYDDNQCVVGLMTKTTIMWDVIHLGIGAPPIRHVCSNPCGSIDCDVKWHGGWWKIEKLVEDSHMKSWIESDIKIFCERCCTPRTYLAHYIATDKPMLPACRDFWLPSIGEVAMMNSFPVELHEIIGEYAGMAYRTWTDKCQTARYGTMFVERDDVSVRIYRDNVHIFHVDGSKSINMFENHLVIDWPDHCIAIMDLDDIANPLYKLLNPEKDITCGPTSFSIAGRCHSYAAYKQLTEVQDELIITNYSQGTDIRKCHNELGAGTRYNLTCPVCNDTCIWMPLHPPLHVKVPAFGPCWFSVIRRGSRLAVVLTGEHGFHVQIHEGRYGFAMLDETTLYMCANRYDCRCDVPPDILFYGNGVSIKLANGTYACV